MTSPKPRTFAEEDLPCRLYVPPAAQGQTVEYSYGATADGVWMRAYDRSDRTESHYFVPWELAKREAAQADADYWNREPLVADKQWQRVTVRRCPTGGV